VLRAIAFIAVPAVLLSMTSLPCFAGGEQDAKQKPAAAGTLNKQEMKSRGFHRNDTAPAMPAPPVSAVPSSSAPKGDSGGAEDTIGGLPGHSSGPAQDKQP
jgi:hypothetical protein